MNKKAFSSISDAFPLVRRVYPSLIANEIVSVQPMSMPSAELFYMDYMNPEDYFLEDIEPDET